VGTAKDRPLIDIDVSKAGSGEKSRVEIRTPGDGTPGSGSGLVIDIGESPKAAKPAPPVPPAPPVKGTIARARRRWPPCLP